MVYITAIHLEGGSSHTHIASCRWLNPTTGYAGHSSVGNLVTWIRQGNIARVGGNPGPVQVGVVDTDPPHLRTFADQVWNDNLLALAQYQGPRTTLVARRPLQQRRS